MSGSLNITAASVDPALLDLPWNLPLDVWPDENIAALPKGISRHLVRFVRRCRADQAENEEPQPQVLVTFGLPNLKPEP